MAQKKVVVIDDDSIALRPYMMELEISGIDASQFTNADDGFEFALENKADLFVIDVMLPSRGDDHSKYKRENTMDFLFTGCVLARDLREKEILTPIIFFTQTSRRDALREIERQCKEIGNCALLNKANIASSFDFQKIILGVLEKGLEESSRRIWFDWIYKAVLFQPNIAGIGLDGKVITDGPKKLLK